MSDQNNHLDKIMARVIRYEQKSITHWLVVFYLFILSLIAICGTISWLVLVELREKEVLTFLSEAEEKEETIIQHRTHQLLTALPQLPGTKIAALFLVIAGLIFLWFWTSGQRHLIHHKKLSINLYHKDHPEKP